MIQIPARVKDALKSGDYKKDYNIKVYDGNSLIKTLDNSHLVAESIKFDERMCSDTELKFGLCEGTSVEFQYFNYNNISGKRINIELKVQYKDENNALAWHTIPMGWYEVAECPRQASTEIFKATAYNKLKSNYLDQDVLADIINYVGYGQSKSIVDILNYLLNGYHIEKTDWEEVECQFWRNATPANGISGGLGWIYIYYWDPNTGQWAQYNKNPYTGFYPYNNPKGGRWVLYSADFYYKADGDTGSSTSHYYKYDDVQLKAIWDIVKENLYYYYEGESGSTDVYRGKTDPTIFMPSSDPHFGLAGGEGGIDFIDYATTYATDNDPDNRISGFFGNVTSETGTSVAGHNGSVNYGQFTGEYPRLRIPLAIVVQDDDYIGLYPPVPFNNQWVWNVVLQKYEQTYQALSQIALPKMYRKRLSPIEEETLSYSQLLGLNSLTLRDLQSAVFEVDCQYGKLDRVSDLFSGIELNQGMLFPRDDLYPADDLFPQGTAEAGYPAMYSKLWADEGNVRSFRYLYVTYKTTENNETVEKVMQKTVNANGTDDYIMDDNWLFKNIVWSTADVSAYADAMVAKMQNIKWFPFEMWCAGLPYLESGDMIEIKMKGGTYPSYVLRRVLNGIQNLQDEMINGTLDIF